MTCLAQSKWGAQLWGSIVTSYCLWQKPLLGVYTDVPMDFPGVSDGKASAYNPGDPGSTPGLGRSPGEGNGNPLQYSCLEKSHGWRSLVGYSLWGHKESDTMEQLHFLSLSCFHVHWVNDAVQPSNPLSSSSPTFSLSLHHGFSNESVLHIRWPKYWSFSFSISPSKQHSGLICFRMDWLDLLAV